MVSKPENIASWITSVATLVIAIITGIGGCIGYKAYVEYKNMNEEYKKMNELSAFSSLDESERRIFENVIRDDMLTALWAYIPEHLSVKERVDKQLGLISNYKQDKPVDSSFNYKWQNVHDLEKYIYDSEHYYESKRMRLRKCYNLAEGILYLIFTAHNAKDRAILGDEYWFIYSGYMYDIGSHPLFIAAIAYGHDYGFYNKRFATMLHNTYTSNENLKGVMLEIYPEMKDSSWIETIGKNKK